MDRPEHCQAFVEPAAGYSKTCDFFNTYACSQQSNEKVICPESRLFGHVLQVSMSDSATFHQLSSRLFLHLSLQIHPKISQADYALRRLIKRIQTTPPGNHLLFI